MKLHRINGVIMRHLYLFPRTLERWAETIYWPVIDLVVWGLTSKWVETAGSNVAHVTARVDPRTGWVVALCALDNLVKGASGQAIQCANAALGLPETTGLPVAGMYP